MNREVKKGSDMLGNTRIFTVKDAERKFLLFSDKKMKKRTKRMGRKFSKDWRTVTQ